MTARLKCTGAEVEEAEEGTLGVMDGVVEKNGAVEVGVSASKLSI